MEEARTANDRIKLNKQSTDKPAEADRSASAFVLIINSKERLEVSETMQTSHNKDSTRHYQTEFEELSSISESE